MLTGDVRHECTDRVDVAVITYEGPAHPRHHAQSALLRRVKALESRFPRVVRCVRQNFEPAV